MSIKWIQGRCSKSLVIEEENVTLAEQHEKKKKSSLTPSDDLESLLCCPIHLGIMERPVQLPCGHSFCLECLERCLVSFVLRADQFPCPVCRIPVRKPPSGQRWPVSYVLNDIIGYVLQQKTGRDLQQKQSDGGGPAKSSVVEKAELVKRLLADISARNMDGDRDRSQIVAELRGLCDSFNDAPVQPAATPSQETAKKKNNWSGERRKSSLEMKCRTELTRLQMREHCEYRLSTEKMASGAVAAGIHDASLWDCLDVDIEPAYKKLVYVDADFQVNVVTGQKAPRQFPLATSTFPQLRPISLRLFHDHIYVSALIPDPDDAYDVIAVLGGVLVKFDLDGTVLACSPSFAKQGEDSSVLPVAGFTVDSEGNIFLARPDSSCVSMLQPEDLTEYEQGRFQFGTGSTLQPQYVCYCAANRQLWVTCPRARAVLILDEITGAYTQFCTRQLYDSLPGHIVSSHAAAPWLESAQLTGPGRICFLDTKLSRLFWLHRNDQYLCIQRLDLRPTSTAAGVAAKKKRDRCQLRAMRAIPDSNKLLLVYDDGSVCLATPLKAGGPNSVNSCCMVM